MAEDVVYLDDSLLNHCSTDKTNRINQMILWGSFSKSSTINLYLITMQLAEQDWLVFTVFRLIYNEIGGI